MDTIYKYTLKDVDDEDILMPFGPRGVSLLHVAFQGERLCLWARVHAGFPERAVRIYVRDTGQLMGEVERGSAEYVGTAMTANQTLVLHVWVRVDDGVWVRR